MPFVTEDGDRGIPFNPKEKSVHHARSSKRLEILLSSLIVVAICTTVFVTSIKPTLDHQRWHFRVHSSIKRLAARKPPEVEQEQWTQAVLWTLNADANCCAVAEFLKLRDRAELRKFADELDHRIDGPVDLKTIDWIWDEFERISKYGKKYSDKWRPGRGIHQPSFIIH
jgi:hypothetical protein